MVAHGQRIGLPRVGNTCRVVASVPSASIPVPAAVLMAARGRRVRPVWKNELGGITFEVGTDPERCFVKWTPLTSGTDLSGRSPG